MSCAAVERPSLDECFAQSADSFSRSEFSAAKVTKKQEPIPTPLIERLSDMQSVDNSKVYQPALPSTYSDNAKVSYPIRPREKIRHCDEYKWSGTQNGVSLRMKVKIYTSKGSKGDILVELDKNHYAQASRLDRLSFPKESLAAEYKYHIIVSAKVMSGLPEFSLDEYAPRSPTYNKMAEAVYSALDLILRDQEERPVPHTLRKS